MKATIPVAQYANVTPEIEGHGATEEEARADAIRQLKLIWDSLGEKPLEIDRHLPVAGGSTGIVKRCRVSGTEVIFDPVAHTYTDRQGRRYRGGSTFASLFKSGFPGALIAGKMATKNDVSAQEILDMWALNAEASSTFGTSVHAALQLYGEYVELSRKVKDGSDESALTSNPVLRPIVEKFFTEQRKAETAFYEEFVADSETLSCGLIDRLVVDEDGLWIEDFKTNASIDKSETILKPFKGVIEPTSLGIYTIQLSYYGRILQAHGRTIKGLRIHHWTEVDGEWDWVTHEREILDLEEAMKLAR